MCKGPGVEESKEWMVGQMLFSGGLISRGMT